LVHFSAQEYFRSDLMFVLVFIQFGRILLVLNSVLVPEIISVLVLVLVNEKAIIFVLVFVLLHKNNTVVDIQLI